MYAFTTDLTDRVSRRTTQEARSDFDTTSMKASVSTLDLTVLENCYFDHYNSLVGLARTLVDDVESAEEVVQQVFANAARTRTFVPSEDALNYIRIGVLNQSRSHLRKRRTQRLHLKSVREESPSTLNQHSDDHDHIAADVTLHDALKRLPRRQRECVTLNYLENLSHAEIAELLSISTGSVKQHLSRGIAALQKALKESL